MLIMAIDGASRRNGKPDCLAVGAVFINNGDFLSITSHEHNSTSQRGELLGLLEALSFGLRSNDDNIYIITDSEYIFNTYNKEWYKSWASKGWITASEQPVKNKDLWFRIVALIEQFNEKPVMYHIKGHTLSIGKVTAANLYDADVSGTCIYNELTNKVHTMKPDVRTHAIDLFKRNHDFNISDEQFNLFAIYNNTADIIAGVVIDELNNFYG